MFVNTQTVSLPACFPIFTIILDSATASSFVFIKAPFPQVASITILWLPDAIFLLIILDAINGILAVQLIASLKAYIFLSAGAKSSVCPVKQIPIVCVFSIIFLTLKFV